MGTGKGGGFTPTSASPRDEAPSELLGRAMEILSGVRHLLDALSPEDVEALAARFHAGVEHQEDRHAVFWRVYAARYRVLAEVFATQHAELLAQAARACEAARESEP
jgi:predicted component of type VI protein secretion system